MFSGLFPLVEHVLEDNIQPPGSTGELKTRRVFPTPRKPGMGWYSVHNSKNKY